jgi:hypothetical protein
MRYFLRVTWLLSLCWSPFFSTAQQRPTAELVHDPKWEIGTDLLWLIDKNTLPKYSLLVRRKIGQYGAIRLRGGYLKNSTDLAFRQNNYNTASLIRIGYEYQKVLSTREDNTKSLVYGGLDYFWRYENNDYDIYDLANNGVNLALTINTKDITHERGGAAFVGFKYFVTTYMSFSVESSFQASHVKYSQQERGLSSRYSAYNEWQRDSFKVLPINTLTISFHF